MKQFLVEGYSGTEDEIKLSDEAFKYLVRVRRHKVGDFLKIGFQNGGRLSYRVKTIDPNKKELILQKPSLSNAEISEVDNLLLSKTRDLNYKLPCNLILFQCLLKGNRMDTVIRQATEVGVRFVVPIYGEFSLVKNLADNKLNRYRRIVKEARQQSNSPINTEVTKAQKLKDALSFLPTLLEKICLENNVETMLENSKKLETLKLCFTEKNLNTKSLHSLLAKEFSNIVLAIGCEGGFSPMEYQILTTENFKLCHFNTNILRAETASLYALASVQTIKAEDKIWLLKE